MQYQIVKVHRVRNYNTNRKYLTATLYEVVRVGAMGYFWKDTGESTRNRLILRLALNDARKMARKHGCEMANGNWANDYWQGLHNKTAHVPDSMVLEDMLKELET